MKSIKQMKKGLIMFFSLCIIMSTFGTVYADSEVTGGQKQVGKDISGHWAEQVLRDWIGKGLINGYQDGTIRPNHPVARAEFVALVNKSQGFTEQASVTFKDVTNKNWFYTDLAKAMAVGYINGYSDQTFKPNQSVTREQAAVMLTSLLKLKESQSTGGLSDISDASTWSKGAIGAVIDAGLMVGNKGKFRPLENLTRAEAVTLLDKVLKTNLAFKPAVTYDKPGKYGDIVAASTINGSVLISASNVTLNNIVIDGDLVIGEGVGQGEVYLNKVTVKGKTTILGGGKNSIHLNDSVLLTVIVNKKDGSIRIVVEGSTSVQQIELQSGARLEESQLTGSGFGDLVLSSMIPQEADVSLSGRFETVDVIATSININLTQGSIRQLEVAASAANSNINIGLGADISSLLLNAVSRVSGQGTIGTATINANGSTIEQTPSIVNVGNGVNATVGGRPATSSPTSSPGTSSPSVTETVYGFSGTIRDVTGSPVPNMRIDFRRGVNSTTGAVAASVVTNAEGEYYVQLVPGIYNGELIKEGFITTHIIGVSLSDYKNTGQDATAIRIPDSGEIRIVLNWGENPQDEDSHLLGPTPNGGFFHTWYGDTQFSVADSVYADLDHDDVDSYGPETTTIRNRTDGSYQFYVHNYSGISTLRNSNARVEIYVGNSATPSKVYQIPAGDGAELYWDVFSMKIVNGEVVEFTERNRLTDVEPQYESTINPAFLELEKFNSQYSINDISVTGATYLLPNDSLTNGTTIQLSGLQSTSVTSATYLSIDPSGEWINLNNLNTTGEELSFKLLLTAEINGHTSSKEISLLFPTVQSHLSIQLSIAKAFNETRNDVQLQNQIDLGNAVINNASATAEDYVTAFTNLINALHNAHETI